MIRGGAGWIRREEGARLDAELDVVGGVAHVARGDHVDGEPDGVAVQRGDDGLRAARGRGDRVLERAEVGLRPERAARGVRGGRDGGEEVDCAGTRVRTGCERGE